LDADSGQSLIRQLYRLSTARRKVRSASARGSGARRPVVDAAGLPLAIYRL